MVEPTNVEQLKEEKPKNYTAQDFIDKYNKLVEETGWRIVTQPTLVARDDGTWSIKQIGSVGKVPEKKS